MEELRKAAREAAQQRAASSIPDSILSDIEVSDGLGQLWRDISSQNGSDSSMTCENLILTQGFLKVWGQRSLSDRDKAAVNNLYDWASSLALPSSIFTDSSDEPSSEQTKSESRRKHAVAVSVLELLANIHPVQDSESASDVIIALASFTSENDAWVSQEAHATSTRVLCQFREKTKESSFWEMVESILKNRIKPLFAKTKNPSITAAGRKNFHPVPLPRFDTSVLDPGHKPWKTEDVYVTTLFSWIVSLYQANDRDKLERHFPLLVPPILALVDDDSVVFKTRGCILLSQFLIPIRESNSDILRRTNLSSVFEDAIRPCFHSLPTITPEEDSIQILGAAYPALRSLLQTTCGVASPGARTSPAPQKDRAMFMSAMTKTLRDHLIPSFHHISSTNTASESTFASFPHPRLSTLLLEQIAILCTDLGIHTAKYLQDIIPPLYSTLSNPFGTANLPLLLSAVSAARAVILTAHPRIWRWRGELLGSISACWLHIVEDEEDSKGSRPERETVAGLPSGPASTVPSADLARLQRELQGLVYLLKVAITNPHETERGEGPLQAKEGIAREIQMLVDADETLRGCLLADIDANDPSFFGLDAGLRYGV